MTRLSFSRFHCKIITFVGAIFDGHEVPDIRDLVTKCLVTWDFYEKHEFYKSLMSGSRGGRSLRGVLVPAEKHDEFELKVEPPNYEDPKLTDLYHEPRKLTCG